MAEPIAARSDPAETFADAERTGLKLAIKGRLIALFLIGAWFAISRAASPERVFEYLAVVGFFALLGILHYLIIESRYDRFWVKYVFIAVDILALSVLIATQPIYDSVDVPQVMVFRSTTFQFYFVVLAVAAFSFSPGMLLWAGALGAGGWLGAFYWAIRDMPVSFNWTDVGTSPTTERFLDIVLNPYFVGTGSRVQEAVAFFVVAMLIAMVMHRARRTVRRQLELNEERMAITEVFGQYVPPSIADALINDRGALQPIERQASVLFADIASFTNLTEKVGPRGIVRILNHYFDEASRAINARGGIITQFQGDGFLATFNVPVEDGDHSANAIAAAMDICELVRSQAFDGVEITVRVGVSTGPVVAGSVGGGGRQSYTVHGDTVNLAARLETLNKEYGTEVLVDGPTAESADPTGFDWVGQIDVRGFSQPVSVFRPRQ